MTANNRPSAVALGFFDGLHLGHIEVIKRALLKDGLCSVVFTFNDKTSLPKFSGKNVLRGLYATVAVLVFGAGMCLCLVWQQFIWGTLVGLLGIVMLIALIPMIKGIK